MCVSVLCFTTSCLLYMILVVLSALFVSHCGSCVFVWELLWTQLWLHNTELVMKWHCHAKYTLSKIAAVVFKIFKMVYRLIRRVKLYTALWCPTTHFHTSQSRVVLKLSIRKIKREIPMTLSVRVHSPVVKASDHYSSHYHLHLLCVIRHNRLNAILHSAWSVSRGCQKLNGFGESNFSIFMPR